MEFLAIVLVAIGCLCYSTEAVSDAGCGVTKGCFKFTPNCSLSDPSCVFFSYAWNPTSGHYDMELSGGTGDGTTYAAVAFGSSRFMQDADMYFCTGNNVESGTIGSRFLPPATDPQGAGLAGASMAATNGGVAQCQFSRLESVTKTVSGQTSKTFNLTAENFYVLLATSSYAGGSMQYHSNQRWVSDNAVQFGNTFETSGSLPATTPSPLTGCGVTKACYNNIEGCSLADSKCIHFSWKYNRQQATFDMELSGKLELDIDYVAIAFASAPEMADADMYFCANGHFGSGTIGTQRSPPTADPTLPNGVASVSTDYTNGVVTCKFKRPASVTRTVTGGTSKVFDLTTSNFYILSATGIYLGGTTSYHYASRWTSSSPLNYTTGFGDESLNGTASETTETTPQPLPSSNQQTSVANKTMTSIPNCTAGEEDCILLTWSYDVSSSSFQMEITGKKQVYPQYIAVAFASAPQMLQADLYYCTEGGFHTGTIISRSTPLTDPSPPNGIAGSAVPNQDGLIRCVFTRPASVTRNVGGNAPKVFDLSNERFYILYARGVLLGNTMMHHGATKWTSSQAVDFVGDFGPATSTTTSPASPLVLATDQTSTQQPTNALTTSTQQPESSSESTTEAMRTTAEILISTSASTTERPSSTSASTSEPPLTPPIIPPRANTRPPAVVRSSTKRILTNIPGCSTDAADCIQLSWDYKIEFLNSQHSALVEAGLMPTSTALVRSFGMEIRGRGVAGTQYLTVAFSSTPEMKDADLYYCTGNDFGSGTLRARYSPPVLDAGLPDGVRLNGSGAASSNGVLSCSFIRPAVINRTDSLGQVKSFDLSRETFHVLFARGPYAGGSLAPHLRSQSWASAKTTFVEEFVDTPTATSTTPSNDGSNSTTSRATTLSLAAVPDTSTTAASVALTPTSTDGCGTTMGCFRMPPECVIGTGDCIAFSWAHDPANKAFKLEIAGAGPGSYAAVAFSPDGLMQRSDVYLCSGSGLESGVIRGRHDHPTVDPDENDLTDVSWRTVNGATYCSFTRPESVTRLIAPEQAKNFSLSLDGYYILVAIGPYESGAPGYHRDRRIASDTPVNFTLSHGAGIGSDARRKNMIKAHAALMILAWVTCVSIGVLIARHFKPLWHGSTCFGTKVWFQIHRALMTTAVVATIVAFVLIFVGIGRYSSHAGAHPIIGIIVTALAISNPIMAFFRPHPNTPKRYLFNWGHWFVGTAARTLSVVAIFLGMDLAIFDLDKWVTWVMVAFVALHIVTEITMEIVSARYGHIDAYVKPNKTEAMELAKRNASTDSNKAGPPKGGNIKYGIMGIYVVANLGFLVAFIVAIALYDFK